jgi:excisionase family DNA binding protein
VLTAPSFLIYGTDFLPVHYRVTLITLNAIPVEVKTMAQTATTLEHAFESDPAEIADLQAFERLLTGPKGAKLVGPAGEQIALTPTLFEVLRAVLANLAHGRAISLVPADTMLTTNETADFLGMSRPHLLKILGRGEIPFEMVGTHRRIAFQDLVRYKEARRARRSVALDEIARLGQAQSGSPSDFGPPREAR